jgi:monofunctional biosynthetic peptidoglycan transglycosylase
MLLIGLILLYGSVSKIGGAVFARKLEFVPDAVLPINARIMLALAGLIEGAVGGYLLLGRQWRMQCLWILWLSVMATFYRITGWWLAVGSPCPLLGTSPVWFDWVPISGAPQTVIIFVMAGGSSWLLCHHRLQAFMGSLDDQKRQRMKTLQRVTVCLSILPVLQTIWVAWANPNTTGPMMIRSVKLSLSPQPGNPNKHQWLNLDDVSPDFLKALLISEDAQFFEHAGFSWNNIRLSLHEAYRGGTPPRGASTVTQQCARSLFLWQGRSWMRKGLEAYYTFWMEVILSKRRILELYVNVIEFGDGIYGIEAAAQHYYQVPASQLTHDQAAMLVAIMPSPKTRDPLKPNERVSDRQKQILEGAKNYSLPEGLVK